MAYIVKQYNHGEYQGTIGDFFLRAKPKHWLMMRTNVIYSAII